MTTPNITIVVVGEKDVGKSSILASLFEDRDLLVDPNTAIAITGKGWHVSPCDLPGTSNSATIFDNLDYDANEEAVSNFIQQKIEQAKNNDNVGVKEWVEEQIVWDQIIKADLCLYVIDITKPVDPRRRSVKAHFLQMNAAKRPILTLLNRTNNATHHRLEWLELLKTARDHDPIDCDAFVHSRDDTVSVFKRITRELYFLEAVDQKTLEGIRKQIGKQERKAIRYKKDICDAIARFIANVKRNSFSILVPKWANEDDAAFNKLLDYAKRSYDAHLDEFIESLAKCCGNFENNNPPADLKFKYTMKDFNKDVTPFAREYLIYWGDQTIALHPKDELLIRFAERLLEFGVKVYRRGYATEPKLPILGKQALKDKGIKKKLKAHIAKYSKAESCVYEPLNDDEDSTPSYEKWTTLSKKKKARRVLASDIHALFVQYLELNTPKVYSEPD